MYVGFLTTLYFFKENSVKEDLVSLLLVPFSEGGFGSPGILVNLY